MELKEMNLFGFLCVTVNMFLDYIGEIEDKEISNELAKIYIDILRLRNHINETMPESIGEAAALNDIKEFTERVKK